MRLDGWKIVWKTGMLALRNDSSHDDTLNLLLRCIVLDNVLQVKVTKQSKTMLKLKNRAKQPKQSIGLTDYMFENILNRKSRGD